MIITAASITDTLTPDLRRKLAAMDGAGKAAILDKIGMGLISMATRSFALDASLRPAPWAPKRGGSPSTLTKSTDLRKSLHHLTSASGVTLLSAKRYAAIHQLGGVTSPHIIRARRKKALAFGGLIRKSVRHPGSTIPARPFLPVHSNGSLSERADRHVRNIIQLTLEKA